MREIKFRAWDNEADWYLPNVQNHIGNSESAFGYMIKNDRYIIEQYTGLHDKNGKEIYEGDKFCIGGVIMFVSWHEDYACFILTPGCGYDKINFFRLDCDIVYQKEIIGNIHESQLRQ